MNPIRSAWALSAMLLFLAFPQVQAIDLDSHPCDSLELSILESNDACVDGDTDPCSDRDKGWGWEYPSCPFDCDPNQYVHVHARVDNGGWVDAKASCGGATATCAEDSMCSDVSENPTTTPTRTTGACKASAYSGWRTNAYVSCWTTDGPKVVPDLSDYERKLNTVTFMHFTYGDVLGFVCGMTGCHEVEPTCIEWGELRTCTIGSDTE